MKRPREPDETGDGHTRPGHSAAAEGSTEPGHPSPGPPGPVHPAAATDTADMPVLDLTSEPRQVRPDPYLRVDGLTATGRDGPIFTDVSFTAGRGELVALVGDSGTGRTSLLLSIAGRFRFDSGEVTIDGRHGGRHLRRRVAVARAAPAITLDPRHTVDQLMTETTVTGCAADPAQIRRVCELLGVHVDSGETFGRLRAVDQALLSLAFAAAARTPIIAIDDVDAGLGGIAAACVWAALRVLADHDHVIIAASVRPDLTPDIIVRMGQRPGGSFAGSRVLTQPYLSSGGQSDTVVTNPAIEERS